MARSNEGFTLVEVLAAVVLFAIVAGALLLVITSNVRANTDVRLRSAAINLAQAKLEELSKTPYAAISSGSDGPLDGGLPGGSFTRTWTQTAGPLGSTKAVTVTVTWTTRRSEDVTLQTVIADL